MRGAKIIRIINLRALSFCEAPEKLRKFANFANLGISCALLSVSIQCWFTSKVHPNPHCFFSFWASAAAAAAAFAFAVKCKRT